MENISRIDLDEFIESTMIMNEKEFHKALKFDDADDLLFIERVYNEFVSNFYATCLKEPQIKYYIPIVWKFMIHCINQGNISSYNEFVDQTSMSFNRMRELNYSNLKILEPLKGLTGLFQYDVSKYCDAYAGIFETTIDDYLRPLLLIFIKESKLISKGSVIQMMKKKSLDQFRPLVKYHNPVMRNAINHEGIRIDERNGIIIFHDKERSRKQKKRFTELEEHYYHVLFISFAFKYCLWKLSERHDRKMIEGYKLSKIIAPDWKLVPTGEVKEGEISFGESLINLYENYHNNQNQK